MIRASHDGYRRLGKVGLHRRTWECAPGGLRLTDEVTGKEKHLLESTFHFHPGLKVESAGDGLFRVADSEGKRLLEIVPDTRLRWTVEPFEYHPRFGVSLQSMKLSGSYEGELPVRFTTRFSWD